jgi:hypothetical protein
MKVIFLDLDGVLNSDAYWNDRERELGDGDWLQWWSDSFDPAAVEVLNKLTDETLAKIVFISNRRTWLALDDIKTVFKKVGIKGELLGITPYLRSNFREDEIKEWLKKNNCESYVILDDVGDFPNLMHRWVEVDPAHGLTEDYLKKAKCILSINKDPLL